MNTFSRSILARSLMTGAASLALTMMVAAELRAETVSVGGTDGAAGADGVNPGDDGAPGGDGGSVTASAGSAHSVTDPANQALAGGGNGGRGGDAAPLGDSGFEAGIGGDGGNGGSAGATAATAVTFGSVQTNANSQGGNGGAGGSGISGRFFSFDGDGGQGGSGGASATGRTKSGNVNVSASAAGGDGGGAFAFGNGGVGGSGSASATGRSRSGNVTVSASATGGDGGFEGFGFGGGGGDAGASSTALSSSGEALSSANATGGIGQDGLGSLGGSATATAKASATGGGLAISEAVATGGELEEGIFSVPGGANATSTAKSTFAVAGVRSIDEATVNILMLSGKATPDSGVATADAVAQAGGAGHAFVKPDNSAYAFSTVLPNKADVATLIGGASNVASAFLGPRDMVFGTAILGNNDFPDGPVDSFTFSESSSFDFSYGGDLLLGLIDGGGEFKVLINGVQTLAESFVSDTVINLGPDFGPNIDLKIVMIGAGDFVVGSAIPESSTWAMMIIGFAGLGAGAVLERPRWPLRQ
jgi:hypothetical protein